MLSNPTILYGVHSISPRRISDGMFYGILKVVGSCNLALSTEQEMLYAGSNKFPWAAESKTISTELTAKVKAYPGFLYELFLGATVVESGADSAGSTTGFVDYKGVSIKDATNGISAVNVSAANKANLKFGKYMLKATGAAAVDIYIASDIDLRRGTDVPYEDDLLKITATPVTIAAGSNVVASLGLDFVGVGTPAFVVGDTAYFEVLPPSTKSSRITVGSSYTALPNFGAIMFAQKRATGEMYEIEAFNVVGGGLPIALDEQAFSQPELTMTCLYDSSRDAVFEIRHIVPETI